MRDKRWPRALTVAVAAAAAGLLCCESVFYLLYFY